MKSEKSTKILVIGYILFSILSFALVLIIPQSREVFKTLSSDHPFIMGFVKFALLATAGELIAGYIKTGKPTVPSKIIWRFVIWGFIGVWITFMMTVYKTAVVSLMGSGVLPGGENALLRAFYISAIMNTSFGPTFMALHKCSDKWLDLRANGEKSSIKAIMTGIDWSAFAGFTILKTVPLFWIPAHTVTFLLPSEYQVMMAAALSVALGIILSFGNRKKSVGEGK